jgi:hypothetical protein
MQRMRPGQDRFNLERGSTHSVANSFFLKAERGYNLELVRLCLFPIKFS